MYLNEQTVDNTEGNIAFWGINKAYKAILTKTENKGGGVGEQFME